MSPLKTETWTGCAQILTEGMRFEAESKTCSEPVQGPKTPSYNELLEAEPRTIVPRYTRHPSNSGERKNIPVFSGVLRYFPNAVMEVAKLSKYGNDKHNPGQPLHWSRGKSDDHGDCIIRHQLEWDQVDENTGDLKLFHAVSVAWRALAQLQVLLEKTHGLSISPGSRE